MSCIFYYSNYCPNCRSYLQTLSHSSVKDEVHFICLDKRTKKPSGSTYVILDNGQEILLPPTVTKVPALLLLKEKQRVLFGEEIQGYFHPKQNNSQSKHSMEEPDAFTIGKSSGFGVASDNFSFLDQTAEELSAQGNGGMRQNHHYVSVNSSSTIETPDDTYEPDTIGNISLDQLQQKRNQDIGLK